jgi:hypothetical protein
MDIDGGAANDVFNLGATTNIDVVAHGASAGKDLFWDASGSQLYVGATVGAGQRAGAAGDSCITIFNGAAAPAGALANAATFFCEAGEMKVLDAAGNSTTLSPHSRLDGSAGSEWTFHCRNTVTGRVLHVEMERLVKKLAEKFPEDFAELVVEVEA